MSFHSRSSSELEITTLRDVLPRFYPEFNKDFSFWDVKDSVKQIFLEEEMRLILSETDEKKQNLRLFWILYENETYIEKFLYELQQWYPWLSKMVNVERDNFSCKETDKYTHAVQEIRSDFQKHLDFNVHRMEYYWPMRMALKKIKPFEHVVLSGELGAGKKWLVIDVCCEYSIMKAMNFNIFWLDVQNCCSKEEDFRSLQQLRLLIGEDDSSTLWCTSSEIDGVDNKILHLKQYIRDRLQHDKFKDCLLILSGVQNSKTWKTFNLRCKTLIITRNKQIINSMSESTTTHISIDHGLTTSECYQLFEKVLQRNRNTFHKDICDIFHQSAGHPYLLSIIANNLRLNKMSNWDEWIKNLKTLQITSDKYTMIVETSLKFLKPHEMLLYKTLAIFPHSIKIPVKLIAALWNKTERESTYVLVKFDKYSIINREYLPDRSSACIVPYIYTSYLKGDPNIDRIRLHREVVAYYKIYQTLENRVEVDLFSLYNDEYFYHCIGYHLRESGYLDLFPKLFLDFGFLGEKLRSDGFPNTIGDLKYFRREITNGDHYKNKLLSELLEFLPNIEEMLFRSKDTCLLQYALMADGLVRDEAEKQARKFPDKMWFAEKGHFHQRRQMLCLPSEAKVIKLPEPDTCIIALENNDILVADLSLDYSNEPVYLTENEYPIVKIELILNDNYIISLDARGNLKVWCIADNRRRSASRKRSSRTRVNPLDLTQSSNMMKQKYKQLIQKNVRGAVQAFYIETLYDNTTDMHLAFANGDICVYTWKPDGEQFEVKSLPILPTKVQNISYLSKILQKYYLLLSNSGKIFFYRLRDGSQTAHSFIWQQSLDLIYVAEYMKNMTTYIIFVTVDTVKRLVFPKQKFELLDGSLQTMYRISDNDPGNTFTCAALSRDGKFLVLGTKFGLIVFNIENQSEVLRGNISECITCVDIYPLDDEVFKYIIVCGSEKSKIMNLFALRQFENSTVAWAHRQNGTIAAKVEGSTNSPQLEPDVWLQGKKLFDLNYSDSILLVAVDSKNRIHQLCTTNTKNWSISLPPETSRRITAITLYNQSSFCGYENGCIFNINKEVFEPTFTDERITFLKLINECTLVASASKIKKSIVRHINDDEKRIDQTFDIDIFKCFLLFTSYLILVDPKGHFIVVDLNNKFETVLEVNDIKLVLQPHLAYLGGADLKNGYFILATKHFKIYIYKFHISDDKLKFVRYFEYANSDKFEESDELTCISSSLDAELLAVGFNSGTIEIYQLECQSLRFIFRLVSHTSRIYDLKFSPNSEILVSCSGQLCFWHITYVVNNPFDSGTRQKRRSSRFTSSHSPVEDIITESDDDQSYSNATSGYVLQNPWSNKRGPMDKPELLSCIKFVGNKAEIFYANHDFTQFNTIDNEGVYYHLSVHDISRRISSPLTNGNNLAEGDDEVIT